MKRTLLVLTLILALGIGSIAVFAESNATEKCIPIRQSENMTEEAREEWFKEKTEFKKQELKKALENGSITKEEAKEWEEHIKYMEEFHKKNGFFGGRLGRNNELMRSNGQGRRMKGKRV